MNAEKQINKLDWLRKSIIGRNMPFETPFGTRPLVYADYTASVRAVDFMVILIILICFSLFSACVFL